MKMPLCQFLWSGLRVSGKCCLWAEVTLGTEYRGKPVAAEIGRHVDPRFMLSVGTQFRPFQPAHQVLIGSSIASWKTRFCTLSRSTILQALCHRMEGILTGLVIPDIVNFGQLFRRTDNPTLPGDGTIQSATYTTSQFGHRGDRIADSALGT